MSDFHQQLLPILERYLSPINARAFLDKSMRGSGLSHTTPFDTQQLTTLIGRLKPSLKLFLGNDTADVVIAEIGKLIPQPALPVRERISVDREPDILMARQAARERCSAMGASSFANMRILTIVSELARNIVNYSHGGFVELQPEAGALTVTAVDRGPGIANLDAILAGRYRSRTGLGLGIIGVKRLAQQFSIETSPTGTHVAVKVLL